MSASALLPIALLAAGGSAAIGQAEKLARSALAAAAADAGAALTQARRALALTQRFDPTAFVGAGRKGEVVEDEYLAARAAYRRHRAVLYEAVGVALVAGGDQRAGGRYLGRAVLLEPTPGRVESLARSLLAQGRGREVLDLLRGRAAAGALDPALLPLVEQAADAVGLASAQAELDRARVQALGIGGLEFRDGRFRLPPDPRLSNGALFRMDDPTPTVLYIAETTCRTCSADLEVLRRVMPEWARLVLVPQEPEQDLALRQVLALYRHPWPLLVTKGTSAALGVPAGSALVVARGGWVGVVARRPFDRSVPAVLGALSQPAIRETVPRRAWNLRPPDRSPAPPPPGLLPQGFAPGEDEATPGAFTAAVDAYRAGRPLEALRFFQVLGEKGDGWLLPPEARYDQALCLAALGRRAEARDILLQIGDSRFQDAVDRALEGLGQHRK